MKKKIIIISCATLIVLWLFGVIYTNFKAERPITETYQMNEEVKYEDNYFRSSERKSKGYSITAINKDVMTYNEFSERYNLTLPEYETGPDGEEHYTPMFVFDVEVIITKTGDSEDGIDMFDTALVNNKGLTMRVDEDLWDALYPQLGGSYTFRLKPNSEMKFHFPFVVEQLNSKKYDAENISGERISMVISQYPVKKAIQIN